MKKSLAALVALNTIAFAQLDGAPVEGVSVSVTDLTPGFANMTELKIVADNQLSEKKIVRANYVLPKLTSGTYRLDRAYGINCPTKPVISISGVTYNLKKNKYGAYVVDVQMELAPKSDAEVCISVSKNDLSDYKDVGRITQDYFTYAIDKAGSPLDNPVIYNYVQRPAYANRNVAGLSEYASVPADKDFTAYILSSGANPGAGEKKPSWDLTNVAMVPAHNLIELGVKSYGAYKDTRMLVSAVGPFVDDYRWNESTFDGHMFANAEERTTFMGRCWLIAVFNVYSYHYGNRNTKADALTQDEMFYHGKMIERNDPQFGIFTPSYNEGGKMSTAAALISRFLKDSNAKNYDASIRVLSGAEILETLKSGTPIPFSIGSVAGDDVTLDPSDNYGHAMVIDGIAVDNKNQDTLVHIINVDNFGRDSYVYLNMLRKFMNNYVLYGMPTSFEKTDALYPVDKDSDGDGIVDFDEHFRFMSDPKKADSDGDGINDLDEIRSYVTRAKLLPNGEFHAPNNEYRFTVEPVIAFDYKKPETFPQNNDDFDGDGVMDSEEDTNKNGIFEPGESDPLKKNGYAKVEEIPADLAFYANKQLGFVNDVFCTDGYSGIPFDPDEEREANFGRGCTIASAAEETLGAAVYIGPNTRFSNVHAKGLVELSENSTPFATYLYGENADLIESDDEVKSHILRLNETRWEYEPHVKLPEVSFGTKVAIVEKGDSLEINDGDKYAEVTVKEGGYVKFSAGEMYIGKLNLDYGSKFDIQNRVYPAILHLNGKSTWFGDNVRAEFERDQGRLNLARSFKVYQHSSEVTQIDTHWFGTIIAPKGRLAFGIQRGCKVVAGQFLADVIQVRFATDVYPVVYQPNVKPVDNLDEKTSPLDNLVFFSNQQLALHNNITCLQSPGSIPYDQMTTEDKELFKSDCAVVSAGKNAQEDAVYIGPNTKLGEIYANGNVMTEADGGAEKIYLFGMKSEVLASKQSVEADVIRHGGSVWNFDSYTQLPEASFGDKVVVVEKGDSLEINDGDKYAEVTVKEGGYVKFSAGEMYIGKLNLDYGSKFDIQNRVYPAILHLNGMSSWFGDNVRAETERDQGRNNLAKSFKVYQHSDEVTQIDTRWFGTIIAPKGRLAFGIQRGCKTIAGQFFANVIQVRFTTDVYQVPYSPVAKPVVDPEEPEAIVKNGLVARDGLKIVGVNKYELMFESSSAARYQVMIAKVDGSSAVKYSFDKGNVGVNKVNLVDAKLSRGHYFVTIKQGSVMKAQMLVVK